MRCLLLLVALAACDDGRRAEPVSEALLVALAQVRGLHHQADIHLANRDPDAAIAAVARVLDVPFPAGAPEGEDTRLDARARLAKLYLERGRLDDARRVVDEGFRESTRESFFLANLAQVSGEVHEARARRLDADDPVAARAARTAALLDYERAVTIAERIQKRLYKESRP